jgi:hypothetical protein
MAIVLKLQLGGSDVTLAGEPRDEGRGKLYDVEQDEGRVAKLLKPPPGSPAVGKVSDKLDALLLARGTLTDEASHRARVAWPDDLLLDSDQRARGYVMKRLRRSKVGDNVDKLFDHAARKSELTDVDYAFLLKVATNLAMTVASAERGILDAATGKPRLALIFADLREEKLWIDDDGFVTITDADAVQIEELDTQLKHLATPPQLDRSPPTTQLIVNQPGGYFEAGHDPFALAVTLFRLLMERAHPFGPGVESITGSRSAYFRHRLQSEDQFKPPLLELEDHQLRLTDLDPRLRQLFERCFETGLFAPDERPSAAEWVQALEAVTPLRTCAANPRHKYFGHLNQCPWHRQLDKTSIDPFPHVVDAPSLTALEPAELPPEGGPLRIRGKSLAGATRVLFGSRAVEDWQGKESDELRLIAPAGKGTVDVTVVSGALRSGSLPLTYRRRVETPRLTSIDPPSLPSHGGALLLFGEHLEDAREVLIGGRSVLFEQLSNERLRVEAPAGRGPVPVQVMTAGGGSNTVTLDYPAWDVTRLALIALVVLCVIGLIAWLARDDPPPDEHSTAGAANGGITNLPENPNCELTRNDDTNVYVDNGPGKECGFFYQLQSLGYTNREQRVEALRKGIEAHWQLNRPLTTNCPRLELKIFEGAKNRDVIGGGIFVPNRGNVLKDLPPMPSDVVKAYPTCFKPACRPSIAECKTYSYEWPSWCKAPGPNDVTEMCSNPCLSEIESCYLAAYESHCPHDSPSCSDVREQWRQVRLTRNQKRIEQKLMSFFATWQSLPSPSNQ